MRAVVEPLTLQPVLPIKCVALLQDVLRQQHKAVRDEIRAVRHVAKPYCYKTKPLMFDKTKPFNVTSLKPLALQACYLNITSMPIYRCRNQHGVTAMTLTSYH